MTLLDGKLWTIIIPRDDPRHLPTVPNPQYSSAITTMYLRSSTVFAALGCVLLASCYPYNENRDKKTTAKPAQKTVTSPDQQKVQQERDRMKETEEAKKKEELQTTPPENPGSTQTGEMPKPPVEEKRADQPVANKVPGKEGFVFSPYNNKVVDVRDIPPGTLVQDPTYTGAGKGYFRVP